FVLQYLFEHFFPEKKKYNSFKNELKNIGVGIFNGLILFIPSALIIMVINYSDKINFGLLHFTSFPFWLNLLVTIFLMDIGMYWWHRANHTVQLFWRFHRFHHLDQKMNTTTAVRFHFIELLFAWILKSAYIFLLGISFLPLLIYEVLFFIVVVIHHSNISVTAKGDFMYRKLFSSPLMHRIHHSNIKEEMDTNYGSVFSFWDRLFGTYKRRASSEIVFGVDERLM
ncbi:MAG: sterol desaturase family protein, partial [Ginsengibacter sp.]